MGIVEEINAMIENKFKSREHARCAQITQEPREIIYRADQMCVLKDKLLQSQENVRTQKSKNSMSQKSKNSSQKMKKNKMILILNQEVMKLSQTSSLSIVIL